MFEIKEGLDILEARIARANTHWNILMALNLAVAGWLSTRTTTIILLYKVVITVLLALAYVFILSAILRVQKEMILVDDEVKTAIRKRELTGNTYAKHLLDRSFRRFPALTIPFYLVLNGAVIVLLWLHPFGTPGETLKP